MKPPYKITDQALNLCLNITAILDHLDGIQSQLPRPELRKENRIKTIRGSLATASRDLKHGIGRGMLEKTDEKALTQYNFK